MKHNLFLTEENSLKTLIFFLCFKLYPPPPSFCNVDCSEVIKGLVFKKNAAHKHMPTSCHNPRLLLLKGVLGHSDVGLSSFNSMDQVCHYIYMHADIKLNPIFVGLKVNSFLFASLW